MIKNKEIKNKFKQYSDISVSKKTGMPCMLFSGTYHEAYQGLQLLPYRNIPHLHPK